MDETAERLVSVAASSVASYARQIGRNDEPQPGTMGAYYRGFRNEFMIGQAACTMQTMRDDTGHSAGLLELIRESDSSVPGQAHARVAGYLHEYLKLPQFSMADVEAGHAAHIAWFDERYRSLFDKLQLQDEELAELLSTMRTPEDREALNRILNERVRIASENERTAIAAELQAREQPPWRPPQERLAELIEQSPDVFAHQAFPPELRLLASRALLRAEGSGNEYPEPSLTKAEKRELLKSDRYPLLDPVSGGVVAMTAASPDQIRMFLLTGREPGNVRQLTRELAWAAREAERFSKLDAVLVPPGDPPGDSELRVRGPILTVVTTPGRAAEQPSWLARERDSFEFWKSTPNLQYNIMARRGIGVRLARDHGLLEPRPSEASVILQTFGKVQRRNLRFPITFAISRVPAMS